MCNQRADCRRCGSAKPPPFGALSLDPASKPRERSASALALQTCAFFRQASDAIRLREIPRLRRPSSDMVGIGADRAWDRGAGGAVGLAARMKKARYAGQFARRRRKECKPPSSVICHNYLTNSQRLNCPGPSMDHTTPLSRWPRRATAQRDRVSRSSCRLRPLPCLRASVGQCRASSSVRRPSSECRECAATSPRVWSSPLAAGTPSA